MKDFVKRIRLVILVMILTLTLQSVVPAFSFNQVTVQAATTSKVRLNVTKKTLMVGKTVNLKVIGTKNKVTWSSSKKSVATVSKTGKVTAKAIGTAKITAKVNNKKYTCKITVKAPSNPMLEKVPFDAKEMTIGPYFFVYPKSWVVAGTAASMFCIMPKEGSLLDGDSYLSITLMETGAVQEDAKEKLTELQESYTQDELAKMYTALYETKATIQDLSTELVEINSRSYVRVKYSVVCNDKVVFEAMQYHLFADGYTTIISVGDNKEKSTPSVSEAANYLLDSLTKTK